MHFYRRWQPVTALSFDLDDTLYDNGPAIARAEQWMLSHLRCNYQATALLDKDRWLALKLCVLNGAPELCHDVSLARQQTIYAAMLAGGMADLQARQEAKRVFTAFLAERSKIDVSEATHQLLANLAERYPLVVITNGNLDLVQAGLDGYFTHVYKAGVGAKMKPAPDMFEQAKTDLKLPGAQILHVGDHPKTDVWGARLHGFRAGWLNNQPRSCKPSSQQSPQPSSQPSWQQSQQQLTLLPDVELATLGELAQLLL
ncbi:MAG: HAD-IA family hydrolase [Aeromonas sp.]